VTYTVEFLPRALRQLHKLPRKAQRLAMAHIEALATDPRPADSKLLHGALTGIRRIRVGAYRVLYEIQEERLRVLVIAAGPRTTVYQDAARRQ
jgi:mRNA interferase RelE/StbE